ncbi:centromere protein R isoform X2 [Emydura macquarii macquarii]|uniref:centromere protein R isoform X2 n=1 Tax=Emydura macquarii macquarii TaxID=1129001 RepID=UPI00352BC06C
MPVKRALKLEALPKQNPHEATPLKTRKKNLNTYSPTTGTCRISPFSSPKSHNVQEFRNGLSSEDRAELNDSEISLSGRGQPQTEENKFKVLQSEVENSLVRFLKMRKSLTSLQALEGSRELENIIGVSNSSCNLKAEVQKTKVLMDQAEKLKPLKRSNAKHSARESI